MTPQDKKNVIESLDQVGRALVDIAAILERIKTIIYSDKENCFACDFVEIWSGYRDICKHHKLKSEGREITTKKRPKWCPVDDSDKPQAKEGMNDP